MALTLVTSDLIHGLDYSKLTGTITTWNQDTTGNADTATLAAGATILATARNIGGVSFNGSAAINLPGVNTSGNQNTSGTAAGLSATLVVGSGGTGVTSITALKNVLDDENWTFANNTTFSGEVIVPHGKISILGSNNLTISGTVADHAGLSFATNAILPATVSATNTNTVDLGAASEKFKNLYLGSEIFSGGGATFSGKVKVSDGGNTTVPSFRVGSDTNGLSAPSTNQLNFITNSLTRLSISSTGGATFTNVYSSDTTEQVRIQDNTGAKLDFFGYANGGKGIQAYADNGSTFYSLNLQPLGGNVGIGEPNPNRKLNVASGTSGDGIYLSGLGTSSGMGTNNYRSIEFAYSDTDTSFGSAIKFEIPNDTSHGGRMSLWTDNLGGTLTRALTITSGSEVGIGTTSPDSYDNEGDNLVIYDSVTPGITIALPQSTAASSARGSILFSDGTSGSQKYRGAIIYDHGTGMGGTADTMYIRTAINNYIVLGPTGNVGIGAGSSAPSTKLSVNGANYVEMATFAAASGATAGIISTNSGYITSFTARHNTNSSVLVPVSSGNSASSGIKFAKAGIVHITVTQDFISSGSTGYAAVFIRKNGSNIAESLRTNTNGQWTMFNSTVTTTVAVNDIISFFFSASNFTSMDPTTWSQYSFMWTSR